MSLPHHRSTIVHKPGKWRNPSSHIILYQVTKRCYLDYGTVPTAFYVYFLVPYELNCVCVELTIHADVLIALICLLLYPSFSFHNIIHACTLALPPAAPPVKLAGSCTQRKMFLDFNSMRKLQEPFAYKQFNSQVFLAYIATKQGTH